MRIRLNWPGVEKLHEENIRLRAVVRELQAQAQSTTRRLKSAVQEIERIEAMTKQRTEENGR